MNDTARQRHITRPIRGHDDTIPIDCRARAEAFCGTRIEIRATMRVCVPVIGCSLAARSPLTPRDLIMNLTAREYVICGLITAAWRAWLPVVTNGSIAIHRATGAEPLRTTGIWMRIGRAALVLIYLFPLTVSTCGT